MESGNKKAIKQLDKSVNAAYNLLQKEKEREEKEREGKEREARNGKSESGKRYGGRAAWLYLLERAYRRTLMRAHRRRIQSH